MDIDLRAVLPVGAPRAIPELSLPSALRLLVLAPHPDDFDAIGVALKFFCDNGHLLDVAVVPTGSGVDDSYRPGLSLADKADLRAREQRRSLQFFGLPEDNLTFLSLVKDSQGRPGEGPENRDTLAEFLSEKAPDIVFLPHGNDTNISHRAMYSLLGQAAQRSGRALAAFLNRDPKTIEMRTDLYMPFGQGQADWKAELLRFHDSQHQRNLRTRGHGFDDRILDVNRAIACELSLDEEYAEAFEIEFHNLSDDGSQQSH